jgi:hypothetical protein
MSSLLSRIFDRRVADPTRLSTSVAVTVGGLVSIGGAVSNRHLRAACYGLASAIGVGIPLRTQLEAERDMRQEARDLWGLAHTMTDGRPWPPPGGWALGANAIAWLLREMHARESHTVVELGPGTSSVILGCNNYLNLEMVGIEHDQRFVESVTKQLALNGLDTYRLVHIPLKALRHEHRTVQWYDDQILDVLPERIEVLIVDGPPNWSGTKNRSPAWPMLQDRMPNGAIVLVDDTHRSDERQMVNQWVGQGNLTMLHDGDTFVALEVNRNT